MKKVLLTCMLALGVSSASFANYIYTGPTYFVGNFVNCAGTNFNYCMEREGPNWDPAPGDVVTIYDNDGKVIGKFILVSCQISDSSPSEGDQNPEVPEGTFEVKPI